MKNTRTWIRTAGPLLICIVAYAATADEPGGFFGLKFGVPVPSEAIVDKEDPKFASALQNLSDGEQALARGQWLEALDDDPSLVPDETRRVLNEEMQDLRFLVVVSPPEPNRHFDDYVALVTPGSGRLGGIWAYGSLDPCTPTMRALAEFLLNRYPSLKPTPLTKRFREQDATFIELVSKHVRLSLMCDRMITAHTKLEAEAEIELEQIFRRVSERLVDIDTSGL